MQTGSFLWKDGKCWSAWRTLCATSVLPWWPTWCLHKHRSRLPCRWSSDGNLLLGKREIHRLHQSQRVSAGLESSIIFNNYNWQSKKKKRPLLSLLQLMEIATDPLRHNNGVIDTQTGQFNCCENAWSAETQRDGEKERNSLRSQSRSSRWGVGVPACCLAIPKFIQLQLEVKYELLSKDGHEESDKQLFAWMDGNAHNYEERRHECKLSCHPLLL